MLFLVLGSIRVLSGTAWKPVSRKCQPRERKGGRQSNSQNRFVFVVFFVTYLAHGDCSVLGYHFIISLSQFSPVRFPRRVGPLQPLLAPGQTKDEVRKQAPPAKK